MAAALLHQAAPPPATAKPRHLPWVALSSTSSLSPLSRRRRRRATTTIIRSAATDSSIGTGAAAPKKATRKEKQQERRRQQDVQQRQQQLLLAMGEAPLAMKKDGFAGGGGGEDEDEDEDEDELPKAVFDRILRRIMVTVGVPMASGVALLNVYDALKRGQGVDVPSWLPLLTLLVAFGTSALGIAYGTLSASWDPDKEGSLLGVDEARANWPVLWKEEIDKKNAEAEAKAKQGKK